MNLKSLLPLTIAALAAPAFEALRDVLAGATGMPSVIAGR